MEIHQLNRNALALCIVEKLARGVTIYVTFLSIQIG